MEEKVKAALEQIKPVLASHGGGVEFVGVEEGGVVKVKLTGHCAGCPFSLMTTKNFIEAQLKEMVPEVKEVQAV